MSVYVYFGRDCNVWGFRIFQLFGTSLLHISVWRYDPGKVTQVLSFSFSRMGKIYDLSCKCPQILSWSTA